MKNPFQPIVKLFIDALSKYSVKQEDVVGLDITPGFIRIAQLSENRSGFVLEKIGYKFISGKPEANDIEIQPEKYVEKLRELVNTAKFETTNVALSVPITSAIIRTVTLPLMSDEEIHSAIEFDSLWSNILQIEEKLQEYSIFWQVINRNPSENTMELLFVASKLSEINHYVEIATKAGLNPVVVDVRCFAIRNALKTQRLNKNQTTALIEFGALENYVLIVSADSPFIYDIYMSESDRMLIESGVPSGEQGERLYNRFSDQVRQAFRAYETRVGKGHIEKVLLVSPIQDVGDLRAQMQKYLDGYFVELFNPLSTIQIPANLKEKVDAEPNPSVFSSALGLATRKVDVFGYYKYVTGVNNVNLLPNRDIVKSAVRKKIVSKLWVLFVLIAAGLLIASALVYQYQAYDRLEANYESALELEKQTQAKEAQLAGLLTKKERYAQMLNTSKLFQSNQSSTFELLDSINRSAPGGVWFTELIFDSPATFVIKGDASNDQVIVNLVERLQKLPLIERASLQKMNINIQSMGKKNGNLKQFEVRCIIKPSNSAINPLKPSASIQAETMSRML